ncbi:Glutathione S-transferase [Caballeronia sordidicola]|uniref:Glutathione S-transferase n=1 Tax=Caballeronia sordidicola TaxID=196367 RepID=A0A242N5U5_CABSO|nr:Glutathione S-transferase [Caballeronia sordidicola]
MLLQKNVPFKRIDIDLSAKPDWFLAMSPTGKVPMLQVKRDGGTPVALFESMPICEYLDETQVGPRLRSDNPLIRAQQRAWIEFGTAILMDTWAFLTATDDETATTKSVAIRSKLMRLEEELGSGPYFESGRFSMVDAVFAPIFRWFDALGHVDFKNDL